ncbi:hypothetical protein [Alteromonas sp. H39]
MAPGTVFKFPQGFTFIHNNQQKDGNNG